MNELQLQDKEVIAIVGPTASGKTALSIQLAKQLNGEIINGDSMQVYQGLDIGTAKVTKEEMAGVPHHLLSFLAPTADFSVADFQCLAREKIADIQQRGRMPIIVGGTGLYVQAALYDFRFTEAKIDEALRLTLYEELEANGPLHMHQKLEVLDAQTAQQIHPNNTRRVVRALEMALTGEKKSTTDKQQGNQPLYNHAIIGLDLPREKLYERINQRVDAMMAQGLLQEVEGLYNQGIRDVQAIQAIGYKEIYAYLDGQCTLDEALDALKQNSRRYAKRQLTYFRNKMDIQFINPLAQT
ncbi:tRNA dimethylallyltransferase [Lysinibacillus alkalisoli]|uniref:tRNA dimethylallyltransferase n=1 Tax=Lysinibacillus alkalisoli TaxID=1911548 RepID=A0A917G4N1_9BACI|nr:tRNA (adenosine(37)-N6)-dimethylallyltransferase MiaA [Lysinibacillus alkalisoli]GGG22452.1 tRNA dimethylallyltransferase [Lysinibacillus alkalisoli]